MARRQRLCKWACGAQVARMRPVHNKSPFLREGETHRICSCCHLDDLARIFLNHHPYSAIEVTVAKQLDPGS